MRKFTRFEVCGLYFILQQAGSRCKEAQFQLCDEAFSCQPITFTAAGYEELFLEVETYIGLELAEEKHAEIRSELDCFRTQRRKLNGLSNVLGHAANGRLRQNPVGVAVGM